jgi:hypothetical protein
MQIDKDDSNDAKHTNNGRNHITHTSRRQRERLVVYLGTKVITVVFSIDKIYTPCQLIIKLRHATYNPKWEVYEECRGFIVSSRKL